MRRSRIGFTLLELIVVVVVASVLAAIAIPSFDALRERASINALETTANAVDRDVRGLVGFSDGSQSDVDDSIVTALAELPETLSVVRDGNQIDFIDGDICIRLVVSGTSERGTVTPCNTVAPASTPSASPTPTPTPTPTPLALSYLDQSFDVSTASESLLPTVTNGTAVSFSLAGTLPANVSFNTTSGAFTGPVAWSAGLQAIDGGSTYACGITLVGAARCWGSNTNFSLGDGTNTTRTTPVTPNGLSADVAHIRAGSLNHTCAVKTNGALLCWGRGDQGQVGNGSTGGAQSPVTVIASGVAKVDVNGQHSCAVLTNGEVKCWGLNTSYQLGDGTTTRRTTPTAVPGVTDAVDVAVGVDFSCILTSGGAVRCWGSNYYGSLGDGTSTNRTSPVTVTGLSSGVSSITAAMSHACAVTTTGAAKCWGRNSQGQLGDGTITNRFTPVDVIGLTSGVDRIVTGAAANSTGNTCALLTSGSLKCWGYNNRGQLGTGDITNSTTPVSVTVFGSAQAVSMAGNHACAIAAGGSTKCWGSNDFGQLGDGTVSTYNTSSVPVTGLTGNEGFPAEVTVTVTASSGQSVAATVNLELN